MTFQPTPSAAPPAGKAAWRNPSSAKIVFGFLLCCTVLLLAALPFAWVSANEQQSSDLNAQNSRLKTQNSLPPAPAGNDRGLPYETGPASYIRTPNRTGGPDAYGYVFDDNLEPGGPTFSWLSATNRVADSAWRLVRTSETTNPWDDGVVTTTLPFSFTFYGTAYTQMYISTNGNVHFVTPNDWFPGYSNFFCIPAVSEYVPRPMIAADWLDLVVPTGTNPIGGVYTNVVGTAPNRQYIVEWHNVSKYGAPSVRGTFEIILYESGEIRFQYNDLQGSGMGGVESVIGVQNATGEIALQYTCRAEAVIAGRAIRYRVREAAILSVNSQERGGAPGATIVYTPTLLNRTGRDNSFTVATAGGTWTTTVVPTHTNVVSDGVSIPLYITVTIPPSSTIGSQNVTTISVNSDLPTLGAYTATLVLTTSVSSYGVNFSQPLQIRSGAYGSWVTYTTRLINTSPDVNDFALQVADYQWETDITPTQINDLAVNGSAPFTVTVRVPEDSTLGAFDAITVTAAQLPLPPTYYGLTVFTTTAGLWEPRASMPIARSRGAAVMFHQNDHIYALGGETYGGNGNIPIEDYNPLANTWTTRVTLVHGVSNVAGAVIGDAIYIPGGYSAASGGVTTTLQVYYPLQDRAEVVASDPLPVPRMGAGVAAFGGKLYVIGGADNSLAGQNTVFEYDPLREAGSRWQTKTTMRFSRVYLAAATLGNRIYAAGGMPGSVTEMREVEAYNPVANTWTTLAPMSRGRAGFALVGADSAEPGCGGYLYALGGGWQSYTATGERYDPNGGSLGSWDPISDLTAARRSLAAAYSPSTYALVALGGWSGQYEITAEAAQCSGKFSPPTPTPTVTPCPMTFTDVRVSDYFYEAVSYLYCAGFISGYQDNTFRPYNDTTRGQLCKIIVLAEGWDINTNGGPHFSDVQPDNTFYPYIETAYNRGVISGYADGTFRWGANITRAQLSKIVVLAEGWTLSCPPTARFLDVPTTDPFFCHIETAYEHGVISGYADGTFRPGNNATRGQICKIVFQAVTAP